MIKIIVSKFILKFGFIPILLTILSVLLIIGFTIYLVRKELNNEKENN